MNGKLSGLHSNLLFTARNGHGCVLQYALLHLFGYDLSIDDLKSFRVRLFPPPHRIVHENSDPLNPVANRQYHSRTS